MLVDPLPDAGKWKAIITGVGVGHATRSNHAALTHAEATNDGKAEDGEGGLLGHDLKKVCGPGLAEIRVQDSCDIDHGICSDKLKEPAKEPAKARGHDDGARGGDVGITAFFRQMEWSVVARHGPDDGNKGHEDGDAGWEVRSWINGTPDVCRCGEARQTLIRSVCVCRDEDHDDDKGNDVEGASVRIEGGDPSSGHAGDAAVNEHDQSRKKPNVPVLGDV